MRRYRNHIGSLALALLTHLAAAVTVLVLGFLVGYVLIRGVPNLNADMFSLAYTSDNQSMLPAILNTCTMTLLALLAAVPFGIASAIYLAEYAKKGSKIVALVRVTTETLSGIPSIVYGLFGMLFFSGKLRFGYSMLSGALTLAIMILAADYAHDGGSAALRAGYVPRGQFRPGRGAAANGDAYRAADGHTGHSVGRYSGHRAHCRRDGGADVYLRHGGKGRRVDGSGQHAGAAHV